MGGTRPPTPDEWEKYEYHHRARLAIKPGIENYFGMLGAGKDESLVNCFIEPEEQMIARSLIAWVNDGSHSIPDDVYVDSYTDAVPKYKEVFRRMFYESGHEAHYNMMMKIREAPEEQNNP